MKNHIKTSVKLYLLIGGIALMLTLVIHPLIPDWFEKYQVNVEQDTRSIPNPCILYHDLDHDGYSEMAALKYQENIDESAIKIYAYNGGLIDQWNFEERWLPHSMIFGDYDHDGYDEVYVFTQTTDSLFLYAIDYRKTRSYLLYRKFITRAPAKVKKWDLRPVAAVFVDSDQDGYDELIFNVMAGHSEQPRRLYSFSIHNKKILYQSPFSGAYLAVPQKVMVKQSPFILMNGSTSLNNIKKEIPFSDHSAWLMAFDARLNFVFPPVGFRERNMEITAFPFGEENEQIITLLKCHSKNRPFVQLFLFDWQGKALAQREFHGRNWQLIQRQDHGKGETFLLNHDQNMLYRIKDNLKVSIERKFHKSFGVVLFTQFDLDNDFNNEWITRLGNKLQIVQSDFSHFLTIDLPEIKKWEYFNLSLKKTDRENRNFSFKIMNKNT